MSRYGAALGDYPGDYPPPDAVTVEERANGYLWRYRTGKVYHFRTYPYCRLDACQECGRLVRACGGLRGLTQSWIVYETSWGGHFKHIPMYERLDAKDCCVRCLNKRRPMQVVAENYRATRTLLNNLKREISNGRNQNNRAA